MSQYHQVCQVLCPMLTFVSLLACNWLWQTVWHCELHDNVCYVTVCPHLYSQSGLPENCQTDIS